MKKTFAALGLVGIGLAASACGGTTFTSAIQSDASADATSDGGSSGDGGLSDGSTQDSGLVEAGDPCPELRAKMNALRPEAKHCCPTCGAQQCTEKASDVCCDISVNDSQSIAVQRFEAAVKAFKAQCQEACPATPCAIAPSDLCDVTTSECK